MSGIGINGWLRVWLLRTDAILAGRWYALGLHGTTSGTREIPNWRGLKSLER